MTEPMPPLSERAATAHSGADAEVNRRVRDLDLYLGLLADALRARGARPRKVRDAVGEVRGHCLHTGDDPVGVFGLPEEYASERFRPLTGRVVVGRLLAGVGSALGVVALIAALVPREGVDGVAVTVSDLIPALVMVNIFVAVPWLVYALERHLLPHWIGRRALARWAWVVRASVLVAMSGTVLAVASLLDPEASGRTVITGPRWAFFVTALLLFPLLWFSGPSSRSVPGHPASPYGMAGGAPSSRPGLRAARRQRFDKD